jgi:hypothetical protein
MGLPQSIQSARLSFQSSELVPPTPLPSPAGECCSSPFESKERDTLAWGERVGGINFDEGTDTLVLYVRVYYSIFPLRGLVLTTFL